MIFAAILELNKVDPSLFCGVCQIGRSEITKQTFKPTLPTPVRLRPEETH